MNEIRYLFITMPFVEGNQTILLPWVEVSRRGSAEVGLLTMNRVFCSEPLGNVSFCRLILFLNNE